MLRLARKLVLLFILHPSSFILLAVGCVPTGKPKEGDRYLRPEEIKDFGVLYSKNCAGCHGVDGKFGPAPPLNDQLFLALVPNAELRQVISEGRPGTSMAAFAQDKGGILTSEQVKIIADGIKPRWGPPATLPPTAPPYFPLDRTAAKKEEGAKIFARACSSCHGDHGKGGNYDGKEIGPINDRDFLALVSDQELRRYILTGRPDLGMPTYAEKTGRAADFKPLTSQEIANLVALLAAWRQSP